MKRGLLLTMVMLAVVLATFSFIFPGNSSALLTADAQLVWDDRGTVIVADDMYWVKNLSLFTNQNYNQQLATISGLNSTDSALYILGYSDFHLASVTEVGTLFDYGGSTVSSIFITPSSAISGRSSTSFDTTSHMVGDINHNGMTRLTAVVPDAYAGGLTAWVVGSKVTPTPIPGALVLFGSGLLGLVGIGRKRFMK